MSKIKSILWEGWCALTHKCPKCGEHLACDDSDFSYGNWYCPNCDGNCECGIDTFEEADVNIEYVKKAYINGAKWMKEQMMKDAIVFHSKILPANEIETDYALDDFDEDEVTVITNAVNDGKFKCGDKVIIALFKDE